MKIKRTKTGKTSESKHEIVKTESNGSVNMDDQNCEKPCSLIVSSSPSSSSSSSGKRANNSHRKDKVKKTFLAAFLETFIYYNLLAGKGESS